LINFSYSKSSTRLGYTRRPTFSAAQDSRTHFIIVSSILLSCDSIREIQNNCFELQIKGLSTITSIFIPFSYELQGTKNRIFVILQMCHPYERR
jgi:hypothetical protein